MDNVIEWCSESKRDSSWNVWWSTYARVDRRTVWLCNSVHVGCCLIMNRTYEALRIEHL
jgi:hypothetical protein